MPHAPCCYMISQDELQYRMLESMRKIFSVLADIALKECQERLDELEENWVSAMVGFEGSYSGLVALHCPEPLARRITSGLLQAVGEVDGQDILDAMGEVVNILGGDLKLYLDSDGRQVSMSIPMVFVGDSEFKDEFMLGKDTVTCTMAAGTERLLIGIQLNKNT